ncbi:MAG: hypothetical protein AAGH78_06690 [Cyanobacteria bacterium P01_H01_bin.58]
MTLAGEASIVFGLPFYEKNATAEQLHICESSLAKAFEKRPYRRFQIPFNLKFKFQQINPKLPSELERRAVQQLIRGNLSA